MTAAGVKMTPAMGLTCWASFTRMGDHAMVMGDQVLLEDQVNPVMSVALDNGLEVTALHNHFFYDNPKVYFMHIGGMGDQEKLAAAVGKVYAKLKETAAESAPGHTVKISDIQTTGILGSTPAIDPANSTLDAKKLDEILSTKCDFQKGVYKATFGKTTQMMGHDMGNAMGVNTWAAFVGSDDKAAV